jgi:hypothetical protein
VASGLRVRLAGALEVVIVRCATPRRSAPQDSRIDRFGVIVTNEREDLARDIWKAGVTDPDLLAEYLIREGWGKRRNAFTAGIVSTVNSINSIPEQMVRPSIRTRERSS